MISSLSVIAQSTPFVGPNGITVPNFTETNRLALSTPATGLVVYQTDETTGFYVYTGSEWVRLLDSNTTIYSPITNFTESNYSYNSKTGVKLVATNTVGNVDVVLAPKGSGSLLTAQPDGTSTNGNNRGTYSVDLQLTRNANTHVASGTYSVLLGGALNTSSGYGASLLGGAQNTASGSYSSVLGGVVNTASGDNAIAGGISNTAASYGEVVFGNYATTASGTSGSIVSTDRLFAIGNGTASNARSNALSILKNGNTTISGTLTLGAITIPKTDGTNGQVLSTNGSGTLGWTTISSNSLPLSGGTLTGVLTGTSASFSGAISTNGVSILKPGTQSISIGESAYSDTGENVTAIGFMTLDGNTSGNNTAIGTNALRNSGSTSYNTAIGIGAGSYDNTGGYNTFLGNSATLSTTGVSNSTALGNGATVNASNKIQLGNSSITSVSTYGKLTTGAITFPNTDGTSDQVLTTNGSGVLSWTTVSGGGSSTLDALTDAKSGGTNFTNSIIIGHQATGELANASDNVGLGIGTFSALTEGTSNVVVGNYTLTNLTSGYDNAVVGRSAANHSTDASGLSALGAYAMMNNTNGYENTAVGYYALSNNITGFGNTALGSGANVGSSNLINATALGYGSTVSESNSIQLGNEDVTLIKTTGALKTGNVTYPNTDGTSGQSIITDGTGNLSWGNPTIISDGDFNTYGGTNSFTSLTGTNNASFGYNVLNTNSGNYNSAFGTYSLNSTTGSYNSGYGSLTLFNNTSGQNNSAIGYGALNHNTTGSNNSANGTNSLTYNTTGSNNVALGSDAGRYASDGETSITVANNSVFVGENARPLADNQTNQVVIGYNAVGKGSNSVQLGNTNVTSVNTSGKLTSGTITYPNTDGTSGQVLTTNGSGTLSWATSSATVADASLTSAKFYARTLSSNTTLTASDFMIIANGAITITLPSSPVDGQVYMIGTTNSGTTISSNKTIYYSLYSNSTTVMFSFLNTNFVYLIYSSTLNSWMLSSSGTVG